MGQQRHVVTAFVDGQPAAPGEQRFAFHPSGDGGIDYDIDESTEGLVDQAVQGAQRAFVAARGHTVRQRVELLACLADTLDAEATALAELICSDVGKPIRVARGEVARGLQFVRACMEAAPQIGGEVLPLDAARGGEGHFGFTRRVPFGVVGAITPFNAPVNLLVQKLAPALAGGNSVVAKPAPPATRVAVHLARAAVARGLPPGMFNVVTGDRDAAVRLAAHPRVSVVSFTGGVEAGANLLRHTGVRKFVSELGSNAANVVLADADLDAAATKIAAAAFEASGQQCISAQRIIVEERVIDAFTRKLVAAASALQVGDPRDATTDVGPMVSLRSAERIEAMCEDAVAHGARHLLPARREGRTVWPALLADVPAAARLWREEAFGPVAVVVAARDAQHALDLANDSPFGLQGAVFTRDIAQAFRFAESFEVGALWINEASRFRLDMYPFGGMKLSGVGREGIRYAIEEMTQVKFVGFNTR